MANWIVQNGRFILSNPHLVLVGGLIVVSIVFFLMGLFKKYIANRIKNKGLRKTVLSFSSIVLVIPFTIGQVFYNGLSLEDSFLVLYLVNAFSTIFVYWFYEGTHIREGLSFIGKKVLGNWFKDPKGTEKQAVEDFKSLLTGTPIVIQESKYKEDDLDF